MLLLEDYYDVKLQKKYQKILYLSAAINNTFVFVSIPRVGYQSVVHCNQQGKILFQHTFQKNIDSFAMFSQHQVQILEPRQNRIFSLNLKNHTIEYFDHMFLNEECDQSGIQTYYNTRLFCVKQWGKYNQNRFKLTYYGYPLKKQQQPVGQWQSQEDEWTYQWLHKKGNNHSMIILFKPRCDEQILFKTIQFNSNTNKPVFQQYRIKNTIGQSYSIFKVDLGLVNMWQTKKGQFCAASISSKTYEKAANKDGVVNNNYIINVAQNTIRQTYFYFDKTYHDYQIDVFNIGSVSVFHTFYFQDGKALNSPVYYINNQQQKIIKEELWQCSYKIKYYIPGYDCSILMQGSYQNGDIEGFQLRVKKILDKKQISLYFLLHLNQNFHDDLLQEAVQLLEPM